MTAELGSAAAIGAYPCANPRHAGWQLSAGLALLSGLVHRGVDLRLVLHLICSLMQQTRPTASLAKIKRLSALCKMEGTRVPGPFPFIGLSTRSGFGKVLTLATVLQSANSAQENPTLRGPDLPTQSFPGDYHWQGSAENSQMTVVPATGKSGLICMQQADLDMHLQWSLLPR